MISKKTPKRDIRLLLDNIRSVHNVGSIFRTADAAGVSKIYCLGTTPVPNDRFGRKRKDFAKVSLGAEETVSWEYIQKFKTLINQLKKDRFKIIAIEQSKNSLHFKKVKIKAGDKAMIILGNETEGVQSNLLKTADDVAELPMNGNKESLNVSITAGIVLYTWLA